AAPGDIVKVGDVLVVFDDGDPGTVTARTQAPPEAAPAAGRPRAAPAVRQLAVELGVDLRAIRGSGPGGRILATDVRAATASFSGASAAPPAGARIAEQPAATAGRRPLRGVRRVTAETMARSWSEIPHITVMDELDASLLLDARRQLGDTPGPGPVTLGVLLVAAVARALPGHPVLNSSLDGDEIIVHRNCHVGLAVATDRGLVVPVIRDADRRRFTDLAAEVRRLTTGARENSLVPADLAGGTFTVSNYGALGGRFATPLIRPPEAGIMGFGAIRPRPIVVDGRVEARPTLPYSCSADHRLVDGDELTAFSEEVAKLLANPVALMASYLSEA
ncbi:MAG TPA: dihydrolipoamide acetyltransferase family protein, partial [Acidimicrobiia bacterium]|nr:dihydrolipoamide acetyltransferase family protein [Acidimicrobiia bacterium]